MPYTPPKPKDLKARFPELESIPDARIAFAIEEAQAWVDSSWREADYAPALRFLTAHVLVSEGALDGGDSAVNGRLTSDSLGDASRSWASRASESGIKGLDADLASTSYGQRFLALRRANHPAVLVV